MLLHLKPILKCTNFQICRFAQIISSRVSLFAASFIILGFFRTEQMAQRSSLNFSQCEQTNRRHVTKSRHQVWFWLVHLWTPLFKLSVVRANACTQTFRDGWKSWIAWEAQKGRKFVRILFFPRIQIDSKKLSHTFFLKIIYVLHYFIQ